MSTDTPSVEQRQIISAPLQPMSVIACAGSGKTFTAVRRLAHIRQCLGDHRGRVALLSFSNIAVETFRREYQALAMGSLKIPSHQRVEIDTLDGFIATNILRPHAHRTMGCTTTPFLLSGSESFLLGKDYCFWVESPRTKNYPVPPGHIHRVVIGPSGAGTDFFYQNSGMLTKINNGPKAAAALGKLGAYTHELARYWVDLTLRSQPEILRVLARRYPHILIDEAQDIGILHQVIIERLSQAGSQISLIGDPNQGIYEFMGATGSFLSSYHSKPGVSAAALTRNYRSVPAVLDLANAISARTDDPDRTAPSTLHGAYFVPYTTADTKKVLAAFQATLVSAGLDPGRSAVLCRARKWADELAGHEGAPGVGTTKMLAQAAMVRDIHSDYSTAFRLVATAIMGLTDNAPKGIVARLTQAARYPEERALRRVIWAFTRDPVSGLPSAALRAVSDWQPALLKRLRDLMTNLSMAHGLNHTSSTLGARLSKRSLPNSPLMTPPDLGADQPLRVKINTVHQVKGESLDAVLYMATKPHVSALLDGGSTEDGRIGYVAVTRARDLLWLAVPATALKSLRADLQAKGFKDATATVSAPPAGHGIGAPLSGKTG
ncbi:ATP-dependent helicase [Stenotrophomonas sp. Sm6012]|uniref:ATP-dependent helicase n=1 Tax=Stenotrophomonas sp. Sm6012 TaxID=3002745 RepID=UPI0027E41120|nr:ATP-dependent helicase [Stenotrophomonas sp. Sm6012]MDQ7279656.1 ATP-dependent helicase [Stenotrophomonas sp. Sm6012]